MFTVWVYPWPERGKAPYNIRNRINGVGGKTQEIFDYKYAFVPDINTVNPFINYATSFSVSLSGPIEGNAGRYWSYLAITNEV